MQFSSIGSVQNHVKSMELQLKWQQKQKSPNMLVANESTGSSQTQPGSKYSASAIEQKLKAGQRLTSEEMDYLRGNHPDLYSQAVDAEQDRQSYKNILNKCKTKDEVAQANMHRVAALHDELTAVQNDPNLSKGEKFKRSVGIHMKAQAVSDEHSEFQRSSEYQKLPTEQELREKEKAESKQKEQELEQAAEQRKDETTQTDESTGVQANSEEAERIAEQSEAESEAPQPAQETAPMPDSPQSAPEPAAGSDPLQSSAPESTAKSDSPEADAPQPAPSHAPQNHAYGQVNSGVSVQGFRIDVGV